MWIHDAMDDALIEDRERRAAIARRTLPIRYRAACTACDVAEAEVEAAVKAIGAVIDGEVYGCPAWIITDEGRTAAAALVSR